MKYVTVRMSYLFVSYIFTQFKVWEKVFGGQILFTGSKLPFDVQVVEQYEYNTTI